MIKTWSTPAAEESRDSVPCALCGGASFRPALFCGDFSYVRCRNCGLLQMNPQPAAAAVHRRYREGHGEAYRDYELANEGAFLRLQELSLDDAGFFRLEGELSPLSRPAPRLLDIGCATGALLEKLRDRGWDVLGVEISGPQARYGRERRGLPILELPLEENRLPGNAFRAVIASHLIEHLNRPGSFVREVHRILAPGGRFYLTTPNSAGFQARLFGGRWRSAIFDHLYLFSVKTLSRLLAGAGFTVERVITWGGLAAGLIPAPLKALADRGAKRFGLGDVMILRCVKS